MLNLIKWFRPGLFCNFCLKIILPEDKACLVSTNLWVRIKFALIGRTERFAPTNSASSARGYSLNFFDTYVFFCDFF